MLPSCQGRSSKRFYSDYKRCESFINMQNKQLYKYLFLLAMVSASSAWLFDFDFDFRFLQQCPADAPNSIDTIAFCPDLLEVKLADLPKPYATVSATKFSTTIPMPADAVLNVPKGFAVNVFTDGLNTPRWLALTPDNNVLVSTPATNSIYLLKDTDGDGSVDETVQFAGPDNNITEASGMLFTDGYFYLANTDSIARYNYTVGQENITGTGEIIATFPGGGNHWSRNIKLSPNGTKIFLGVGSATNVDIEDAPRARVDVMNLDGSDFQAFVTGTRNPNGLAFHPVTGDLYTVVNERDELGDNLVPDYFTRIQQGEFFGWPYAYLSPDNIDPRHVDNTTGKSVDPELAARTVTPDVLFQAHSALLDLAFYTGDTFPECYRTGAFVTSHGSWNRDSGTGYKIAYVEFGSDNRPLGTYEDFLTGFLTDPSGPTTWARPVSLLVLPDGSLIFTDDAGGRIFRVQYQGEECGAQASYGENEEDNGEYEYDNGEGNGENGENGESVITIIDGEGGKTCGCSI